jgi:hypothetical protein
MEIDTQPVTAFLSSFLRNPNKASNLLGAILLALGASALDWTKILSGDSTELKKLGAVAIGAALAWYVGKSAPAKPV